MTGLSVGRRLAVVACGAALTLLAAPSASARAEAAEGVVVEAVEPAGGGHAAGLQAGDRLLGWERAGPDGSAVAAGTFASPLDPERIEIRESSLGPVRLRVRRDDELWVEMPSRRWEVTAKPSSEGPDGGSLDRAWLRLQAALAEVAAGEPDAAAATLEQAVAALVAAGAPERVPMLFLEAADGWRRAGELAAAAEILQSAVARLGPGSAGGGPGAGDDLELAAALAELGAVRRELGDLAGSRESLERSVALFEAAAPGSYRLAEALDALAVTRFVAGDLPGGEAAQRRALDLLAAVAPVSPAAARTLTNQASLRVRRGDLAAGEALYREAAAIHDTLGSPEPRRAAVAANLAVIALRRGDLVGATRQAERAIELEERAETGSPRIATLHAILGRAALAREVPEEALAHLRRAVALQDAAAPDDPVAIAFLAIAGWAAVAAGEEEVADELLGRASERLERQPVRNFDVAAGLRALGRVALRRDDLATARGRLEEALEIDRKLAPAGPGTAETVQLLGEVALREGRLEAAHERLSEALALWRASAPDTWAEARTLHLLGRVRRAAGSSADALRLFEEAIALAERRPRLPPRPDVLDYEVLAEERAGARELFEDALTLAIETERLDDAFRIHEQARARAFRDLLAMRDLDLGAGEPVASEPLETAKASALLAALDEGAVLLSYAVTAEHTFLFVLGPHDAPLGLHVLGSGEEDLRDEIARFRAQLAPGGSADAVRVVASRLGESLLGPVSGRIAAAGRVIVAAGGPLATVPFAALALPAEPYRLLVEEKPVSVLDSLESLRRPTGRAGVRGRADMVAFGDPAYPAEPGPEVEGRLLGRSFQDALLDPLPGTRREVEAIASIWRGSTRVFLGPEATEERAKALGPGTEIVHFAAHALVDPRFPLESSIVLALPASAPPARAGGAEDGFLQAWEIFEQIRLDADLVTLSGCDTGSGRELAGEGIVGLGRAFEYAGARSLLASLWKVPDASTARLMASFYRHLDRGAAKDEALRRAQLELLRSPEDRTVRHPYFWAGFRLSGDPR